MEDLLVLPRPAESLQKAQSSEENLEQTGDAKKEGVASAPRIAVGKDARAAFSKWKRNRAISPDHEVGFLHTDKAYWMKRDKVKKFSAFGSNISGIPLKNPDGRKQEV